LPIRKVDERLAETGRTKVGLQNLVIFDEARVYQNISRRQAPPNLFRVSGPKVAGPAHRRAQPLVAVEQSGVSAINMAMAKMYDFAALETYAQLAERFGVRPPQPML